MLSASPESSDDDDPRENAIQRAMDLRGLSRRDAEDEFADNARVAREESMQQHPSAGGSQYYIAPKRSYRGPPPVGEDSVDVMTGIIDPEQALRNQVGAAGVRAAIHADDNPDDNHARALRRAKEDRRGRRF